MKRSELNRLIDDALVFCRERNFLLPPFAHWSLDDWVANATEHQEILDNQMGWDITDFGSGDFSKVGILIFVARNGNFFNPAYVKPYCEKVLIHEEGQICPIHSHWKKIEDFVNRGGGNLIMKVYNAISDAEWDLEAPVTVSMDGRALHVGAGEPLRIRPGESVTLVPYQFHEFWVEPGSGKVLLGEISTVADEKADNNFPTYGGRLPDIEEDERPRHLIFNDYSTLLSPANWPPTWR